MDRSSEQTAPYQHVVRASVCTGKPRVFTVLGTIACGTAHEIRLLDRRVRSDNR
jgi:hypothetical protein